MKDTGAGFDQFFPRLLLCALIVVAFANSLGAGLIFDNRVVILEDSRVRALTVDNLRLILGKTYWWPVVPTALYRPVTTLSYLFNYAVLGNGSNPAGYHVVNLLLHLGNALLVFGIAKRLGASAWLAFAISAVWGVHPLLSEAVTNVVGRADLLAAFGVLAALWCHVRAGDTDDPRRKAWWRVGVAVAAVAGVFAKENAVAVAAVIPLWDVIVRRRTRLTREVWSGWLALLPALLLLAGARAIVLAGQPPAVYPFVDNPIVGASWWQGRLTAVAIVADYLRLVVWPAALSCDYSFPQVGLFSGTSSEWIRFGAVAAAAAAFVGLSRISRPMAFVLAAAFVVFLPASNLLFATGTIMAERVVYLPALAPIAALVVVAAWAASRAVSGRKAATVVLAAVLAALIARTVVRNAEWRDEVSLWSSAVQVSPRSFKTHGALAEALYSADATHTNLPEVIAHKEQSLALLTTLPDPLPVSDVYGQAATYYLERGDWLVQHEPGNEAGARAAYAGAVRWAALFVSAIDAARPGAQLPSGRQRGEAQLLLSTATLKAQDTATAVAAAHRGRLADPFRAAAYQAEAAALFDSRRADDAAVTLLAGFMVTGDTALRAAVMEMYRGGLDRAGCAITEGSNGPILNQRCEIVRRHICAASAEAVAVFTAAGRVQLADSARTTALQQFGCAP